MSRAARRLQKLRLAELSQSKCHLLALPAELRIIIWEYIVANEATDDNPIEIGVTGTPAILDVCKQIKNEIRLMYHAQATFSYTDRGQNTVKGEHLPLYRWLHGMDNRKDCIKRLILRFSDKVTLGSVPLCDLRITRRLAKRTTPDPRTEVARFASQRIWYGVLLMMAVDIDTLVVEGPDCQPKSRCDEVQDFRWWWKQAMLDIIKRSSYDTTPIGNIGDFRQY
ncbi:hypothetical protein CLAFUW4_07527 [Fulvia fulva]|uniref:Uncharacterized protein n=1 Tax=Passalora fulva TaxID=5499 RepID=A0A9Q8PAH5_PASFU|nr:uncharacterized protein CLAFUR5_07657 [Fulvia fulva]KAK4621343.1 hypothetical protein CLAFUR4_07533 [Fulvia fulva]KAK4622931.1 hypothetical protein CLAFUR0_07532 [Fulvia fulva]UJO18883.1 hypothetical protein CLAFUR5_07657 [Fulvia fulva]WPV15671.1 hypothetical protein CLAFUW4_07527 [Fulvia fulva]WPV31434.1 hypothetical protein CLAFUW7_07529 [Fulvia fulva]